MSNFFEDAKNRLIESLIGLEHDAVHFLETIVVPTLKADAKKTFVQVAPIAIPAILEAATTGKTGSEKFADVKATVISGLKSAGTDVATELLNGAIQAAYDHLNITGQLPASTPAPAAGTAPVNPSVPTAPAAEN